MKGAPNVCVCVSKNQGYPNMAISMGYGNALELRVYYVRTKSIFSWYIMVMKVMYKWNWVKYSLPNFGTGICNSVGFEGAHVYHVFEVCCQHLDQFNGHVTCVRKH